MRLTPEREAEIRNSYWEDYDGDECSDVIFDLLAEIDALRQDSKIWEEAANSWIENYDILKAKYEPMMVVTD